MRAAVFRCPAITVLTALVLNLSHGRSALAAPAVFWASDPVRPDETVLVQGSDLAGVTVEMARLPDADPRSPVAEPAGWAPVPVLQGGDQSVKFAVPADWKPGVYAFRLTAGAVTSAPHLLNAPEPWWLQGDRGATAAPGGWLRVQGKSLGHDKAARARLEPQQGATVELAATGGDGWSVRFELPADLKPGAYAVRLHNGSGGPAAWRSAGNLTVEAAAAWPDKVFSVLEIYGKDAERQMRESLTKYRPVADRTAGIKAALDKARQNGGGVVYFPAGKYGIVGELAVPPKTVLKGEGAGLVVLWWGTGLFNLDGGGQQGLPREADRPKPPATLLSGREFAVEDVSLYLPHDHRVGISAADHFRMRRVRVRVDHLWAIDGDKRPEGTVARLGDNFEVTDCDIHAEGTGLIPGRCGVISGNRILAGKTNCPLGGAREVIVEDNRFVSTYPTAYQNIAGVGRNLYYARNRHEALSTHQADYSFTFDAGGAAYFGGIAAADGATLTLAADPTYPGWAPEKHGIWRQAVVCIQDGQGAGQWRYVVSNAGRTWTVDRPFDCPPDASSVVTIVPMNGRALVVGNRFEDANWVNAGYGTAIDVVYAGNQLVRCAQLLNYGVAPKHEYQPSWYVQYLDNELREGHTSVDTSGNVKHTDEFKGSITRCTVHRRHLLAADNSGGIKISGGARDVIVENCSLRHPMGRIRIEGDSGGVLCRNNTFAAEAGYEGKRIAAAVVIPPPKPPGQ